MSRQFAIEVFQPEECWLPVFTCSDSRVNEAIFALRKASESSVASTRLLVNGYPLDCTGPSPRFYNVTLRSWIKGHDQLPGFAAAIKGRDWLKAAIVLMNEGRFVDMALLVKGLEASGLLSPSFLDRLFIGDEPIENLKQSYLLDLDILRELTGGVDYDFFLDKDADGFAALRTIRLMGRIAWQLVYLDAFDKMEPELQEYTRLMAKAPGAAMEDRLEQLSAELLLEVKNLVAKFQTKPAPYPKEAVKRVTVSKIAALADTKKRLMPYIRLAINNHNHRQLSETERNLRLCHSLVYQLAPRCHARS